MARPFADVLRELAGGATLNAAGEDLAKVVAAVKATGKKGELTLKLTVKPNDDGGQTVTIADSITIKVPTRSRRPSIFFPTDDGDLSRSDPRQGELADRWGEGPRVVASNPPAPSPAGNDAPATPPGATARAG